MVAETMPATSDAVPLLGKYIFSEFRFAMPVKKANQIRLNNNNQKTTKKVTKFQTNISIYIYMQYIYRLTTHIFLFPHILW